MAETMKLPDGRCPMATKATNRAVVEEEEAGALTSTLRCFHCHEPTAWIGFCVHCGRPLMPMESTGRIDLKWQGDRVWTTSPEWPTIVTIGDVWLSETAKHVAHRIRWESPWSIRFTLDNGWAVYALSTMSRIRGFCVGRLVDSELSCIVPA